MIAVKDHVHALEHEALGIVLERQDALAAQNVLALGRHQILHPREKLVRIERLVGLERNRLHILVVVVLQPAMMVVMIAIMVMIVVMIMIMLVLFLGLKERRLDVEDAVEVEGVAAEHFGDVDLGVLGAVQPRIRIDAADARLDLGNLAA